MRILTYRATEQDAGKRVETALMGRLQVSCGLLSRLKRREDGICVNGQRVYSTYVLKAGDLISADVRDQEPPRHLEPVPMALSIAYEDEDLLVVDKPANLPVHPTKDPAEPSLEQGLLAYLSVGDYPHFVSRLDKGTTGLMLVAKSGYIHDRLRRLLHTDAFRRTYRAVTVGVPVPESGTIDAPVGRDERSLVARMVRPDGKPAVTHFRTLASGTWTDGTVLSLVELYPETGRTHQLRVHMAHMGCPLAGDWLYGREDPSLIGRPALHAYRLELVHPVTGERLKLEAPLPPDMARLTQEISRTEGDNNHGNDRQTVSGYAD